MNKLSQEILANYQRRKSFKEKTAFINLLQEHLPIHIESSGHIIKNRNIIIGNIEKAKIILTAHYDTCAWLPFPNLCFPTNLWMMLLYNFFIILLFIAFITILRLGLWAFNIDEFLIDIIADMAVLIIIYATIFGYPNKHNANDNTSGIITLIEMIDHFKDHEDIAFVFFDNEEKGLIGSSRLNKQHFTKAKLIINYDCVGDGDHILVIPSKAALTYLPLLKQHYTDQYNKKFKVIAAGFRLY
ncbi:MAG: M28 family peptidase, partial [Erysipelotrichaceae bacterium]|nr:M28 family peptidase [Erysipelotrichaceae bacterium]